MSEQRPPEAAVDNGSVDAGSSDGVSVEDVRSMLRGVIDPELGSDIVELGMVRDVDVDGGLVTVTIALDHLGLPPPGPDPEGHPHPGRVDGRVSTR